MALHGVRSGPIPCLLDCWCWCAGTQGDDMARSTADESPGVLLRRARSDLMGVAATVDRLSNTAGPSLELLEARRAVHEAHVALGGWSGPLGGEAKSERVLTG